MAEIRVGDIVTIQTFLVCDRSLALIISKTGSGDDLLETENGKVIHCTSGKGTRRVASKR